MDPLLEELTKRDLAARTTEHDDPVIQQALVYANQALSPVKTIPFDEIMRIYEESGMTLSPKEKEIRRGGLGGFRLSNDEHLLINEDSRAYQNAKKNPSNRAANAILASILLHEQVHGTETGREGEFPAHRLQADFLRSKMSDMPGRTQREELTRYMKDMEYLAQHYDKANKAERK